MSYTDNLAAVGVAIAARQPVLLWGDPGQGKTSVLRQVAADTERDLEVVLASIREPADFAGLPIVDGATTRLAAPDWAKRVAESGDAILFFDEISTAPPATQAAMLRVAFDKVAGDLYLGDEVSIVAAANPPETAADGWDLAAPLANRFVHLDWALPAEVVRDGFMLGWPQVPVPHADPERVEAAITEAKMLVGAFIGARPDYVTRMPSASDAGRAWPSPRSWEMAGTLMGWADAAGVSQQVKHLLTVGCVGEAAAGEFASYVSELDLPDPEDVLAHPDKWDVPTRGDRVFAVGASVLAAVAQDNTPARWKKVGPVLAVMAEAGHADVAVQIGRRWMTRQPTATTMPDAASLKVLAPVFREAKIIP